MFKPRGPWAYVRGDTPRYELRFHDDWWHVVQREPTGTQWEVVLFPMGIHVTNRVTIDRACEAGERDARQRAVHQGRLAAKALVNSNRVLEVLGREG